MDLDLRGELQIGGVWVDATGNIFTRQSLTHTRGRQDLGARTEPSTLRPLLNNTDGQYSFDNPRSENYQKGGRNTPFRLSVAAGSTYLSTTGTADRAATPDHSSLDITGDLDIRIEATLDTWIAGSTPIELVGKTNGTPNKSWLLTLWQSGILLYWSADGSSDLTASTTVDLTEPPSGRRAIRVTLDVNNGSGGRTITFYTADSIDGPWTQFGDPVVQSGTTSVFSSTAELDVGSVANIAFLNPVARIHKFELRNGIDGTLVASPDFTAQTPGATSFTDSSGRTWTLSGNASLTNRRTRLHHELTAYPTRWHPSGKHIWVPAETRGILRRYGRSGKALDSTLRRRIPSFSPLAYWPAEDGQTATRWYSPIPGVRPLSTAGFDMASVDTLPGSNPLPAIRGGATLYGSVPAPDPSVTQWHTEFVCYIESGPATARTVLQWLGTGTVARWRLMVDSGGCQIHGYDDNDTEIITRLVSIPDIFGRWFRWKVFAVQDGSNVDYTVLWTIVGATGLQITGTYAGSIGRISGVTGPSPYSADLDGVSIGHLCVFPVAGTLALNDADIAFTGETAGERMQRLAEEEILPLTVAGLLDEETQVGPQRPDTVLSLLESAADADGGILYEDREQLALRYRDRATMYNQTPALVLDYNSSGLADPLEPTGDDEGVENDVTVSRIGGSSARAVLEEGALSVQAPPNGVGTGYDTSIPLNLNTDDQAEPIAYWRMWLGTYEGRRYPQVRVMVHRAGALIDQILAVDIGDKIVIQNPPPWLPPGDIELLVQGYEETFSSDFEWDIVFNCTPAAPWSVGVTDEDDRVDTDSSVLAVAVDADDTSLLVHTPSTDTEQRQVWIASAATAPTVTYPSEFPFDVQMGGEWMTATRIEPASWDTFTRTTSNTWGTSSSGHVWAETGGAASDRSIGGSVGSITLQSAVDTVRFQRVTPEAIGDCEVLVRMRVSAVATGASLVPAILLRYTDTSNFYRARLHFGTGGGMFASITRDFTTIGATPTLPYTYAANDWFWVRTRITGHRIQMRVWPQTGLEPGIWHHDATITTSTIAVGTIGVTGSAFAGNTNASPVLGYDDFAVITPQRFTVQRGLQNFAGSHAAGAELSLAQPTIVAL